MFKSHMTKGKSAMESVSSFLNLTGSVVILGDATEKIVGISSYKNPEMLKSVEKILVKQKIKQFKK